MHSVSHTNPEDDRIKAEVYEQLRLRARRLLASDFTDLSLQPTELVNEAYIRLEGLLSKADNPNGLMISQAARVFMWVLLDYAKKKKSAPDRGKSAIGGTMCGGQQSPADGLDFDEIFAVGELVRGLEGKSPELAEAVVLSYFGGLSVAQIAETTGRHERTVYRQLQRAREVLREQWG